MTAAVILFGAGCLWSIAGALCRLIWTASLWRKLLALATLALTLACCRSPEEMRRNHQ